MGSCYIYPYVCSVPLPLNVFMGSVLSLHILSNARDEVIASKQNFIIGAND
jgi:hypothetical protein